MLIRNLISTRNCTTAFRPKENKPYKQCPLTTKLWTNGDSYTCVMLVTSARSHGTFNDMPNPAGLLQVYVNLRKQHLSLTTSVPSGHLDRYQLCMAILHHGVCLHGIKHLYTGTRSEYISSLRFKKQTSSVPSVFIAFIWNHCYNIPAEPHPANKTHYELWFAFFFMASKGCLWVHCSK